jgi:glycosyltransferase involved in cell wall biosynthesis
MIDGEGRRVIDESAGGLTAPAGDGAALGEAVRRLVGLSTEERNEMGARGRAYALREFDREALFDQFELWVDQSRAESAQT